MPSDRQRFSLAHEIGHLVMHFGKVVDLNRDLEKEAMEYASEFLVPGQEFKNIQTTIDLRFLANQKLYWRVSMASLLYRVKDLYMATENQIRYLWSQMSALGYKTTEPVELTTPKENPSLINDIFDVHIKELNYSKEELSSLTSLYWSELENLLIQENKTHLRIIK